MKLFRIVFTLVVFGLAAAYAWHLQREPLPVPQPTFAAPRGTTELEDLELPRGEHDFEGLVLLADGSAGADVLVHVNANGEPRSSFTESDGTFELTELSAGEHELVVAAPGHLPETHGVTLPHEGLFVLKLQPPRELPVPLPELARSDVRGVVLPALWEPVQNFEVVLRPVPGLDPLELATVRRATVAADGTFRVEGVVHARYTVEVLPPWARGGSWPSLAAAEITLPRTQSLRLQCTSGEVVGLVRDAELAPAHGALVQVQALDDPNKVWPPVITDAGGRYWVEHLPPGDYELRLRLGEIRVTKSITIESRSSLDAQIEELR